MNLIEFIHLKVCRSFDSLAVKNLIIEEPDNNEGGYKTKTEDLRPKNEDPVKIV